MFTVAILAMNLGKRHSQAAHSREYFSFAEAVNPSINEPRSTGIASRRQ
jgi:hypothetical protein